MKPNFKGTVLITGASSGIGHSIALESVKKGYEVIIVSRRVEKLQLLKERCNRISPDSATFYRMDLLDIDNVENVITEILNNHTIDILINNAGMGLTKYTVHTEINEIFNVFKVNTLSLIYISKRIAVQMLELNKGHIIQIGSIAGKVPTPKTAIYSASKAAVISFSNALRQELRLFNITVTTVNTGPVNTEFFDKVDTSDDYLDSVKLFMLTDEKVARKIVQSYWKNKREINLPLILNMGAKLYHFLPSLADKLILSNFKK